LGEEHAQLVESSAEAPMVFREDSDWPCSWEVCRLEGWKKRVLFLRVVEVAGEPREEGEEPPGVPDVSFAAETKIHVSAERAHDPVDEVMLGA
jgi:hypothetical protein